jgi:hypothetical protein
MVALVIRERYEFWLTSKSVEIPVLDFMKFLSNPIPPTTNQIDIGINILRHSLPNLVYYQSPRIRFSEISEARVRQDSG